MSTVCRTQIGACRPRKLLQAQHHAQNHLHLLHRERLAHAVHRPHRERHEPCLVVPEPQVRLHVYSYHLNPCNLSPYMTEFWPEHWLLTSRDLSPCNPPAHGVSPSPSSPEIGAGGRTLKAMQLDCGEGWHTQRRHRAPFIASAERGVAGYLLMRGRRLTAAPLKVMGLAHPEISTRDTALFMSF